MGAGGCRFSLRGRSSSLPPPEDEAKGKGCKETGRWVSSASPAADWRPVRQWCSRLSAASSRGAVGCPCQQHAASSRPRPAHLFPTGGRTDPRLHAGHALPQPNRASNALSRQAKRTGDVPARAAQEAGGGGADARARAAIEQRFRCSPPASPPRALPPRAHQGVVTTARLLQGGRRVGAHAVGGLCGIGAGHDRGIGSAAPRS